MKTTLERAAALLLPIALFATPLSAKDRDHDDQRQNAYERGRYLVIAGGCNDCHTPGYAESAGTLPDYQWLTGNPVGFQGPWGVSYPVNLRLLVQSITEEQWLGYVRSPMLPPMPWFNLRDMHDRDLRAIYRFIRALGPAGQPAPEPVAPGQPVNTPYIDFMPKNLPAAMQ